MNGLSEYLQLVAKRWLAMLSGSASVLLSFVERYRGNNIGFAAFMALAAAIVFFATFEVWQSEATRRRLVEERLGAPFITVSVADARYRQSKPAFELKNAGNRPAVNVRMTDLAIGSGLIQTAEILQVDSGETVVVVSRRGDPPLAFDLIDFFTQHKQSLLEKQWPVESSETDPPETLMKGLAAWGGILSVLVCPVAITYESDSRVAYATHQEIRWTLGEAFASTRFVWTGQAEDAPALADPYIDASAALRALS